MLTNVPLAMTGGDQNGERWPGSDDHDEAETACSRARLLTELKIMAFRAYTQ